MPRFVVEESEEFSSLAHAENEPQSSSRGRAPKCNTSLSCLSPDGRTMYSLNMGEEIFIEAHNLPLEGYTEQEIEREYPALIRTRLPSRVVAMLRVDAPVELFCADGDSMPTLPRNVESSEGPQQCLLPLLCLYTRHSVFLLQLAFTSPFQDKEVINGTVLSVTEPLESHLVSESSSTCIVRVRPAPQRRMGFATMCPPGSMAMLTRDSATNEYALVLYHGPHDARPKGWISVALRFGMELLADDDENTITDFSFAQSNGQALLATMSVHLLKASGDVLGASPILFDGSVVAQSMVCDCKEYLQYMTGNGQGARALQCLAALQYMNDAFGAESTGAFVTARTSIGGKAESSLFWPIQVQGPVLVSSPVEPDQEWNQALVIEPFFARDLVGMAIGRERNGVDFAVIPATSLLPRFSYMDDRDQVVVDNMLADLGVVVERVIVDDDDSDGSAEGGFTTLVRDPTVDNMIHYASARGVVSITTTAMRVYSKNVREQALGDEGFMSPSTAQTEEKTRTMAWSSLDVSAGDSRISLTGAVVSGDALLGHTLVVSLSDGSPAAINLTESRYLHDAESIFQNKDAVKQERSQVATEALKAMESTPPLHELLAPLFEKVQSGLAGMGKIVGGQTEQKDITPSTLATVIAVKERCEKEVVLPLQEMDRIAASRLKELKEMYMSQVQQMAALKETIQLLKDRMEAINQEMKVAESNATLLAQRSGALLQATQDLRPSLTAAESDYFDLLKRVKAKCDTWEETISGVVKDSKEFCGAVEAGQATANVKLGQVDIENCHAILRAEDLSLQESAKSLEDTKWVVNQIAASTGLAEGDENLSPPKTSGQQQ